MKSHYHISDIALKEINHKFITDWDNYLRTKGGCGENTTAKFMQFFKRIILIARLLDVFVQTVSANLGEVFKSKELFEHEVTRCLNGAIYYNLDVVIALVFRMKSGRCRIFRERVREQIKRSAVEILLYFCPETFKQPYNEKILLMCHLRLRTPRQLREDG